MGLKILQLISSAGFFGAENVLLELSCELKNLGHSVTVGIFQNLHNPNFELAESAKNVGIGTQAFKCSGKLDLKTVSLISSYVRENSFDVVHSHGYKSNIYAVLSNMRNKKKLVATCHNWIESSRRMSLYTLLDKLFLKRFDAVVPVSTTVRALLLKAGLRRDRLFLIENGINTNRFNSDASGKDFRSLFFATPGFVIGTVGRLTSEKGHAYMLKAAKRVLNEHKDCFFMIVGDGALKKNLEDETAALGIADRTVFTGRRSDIPEMLSVMDIFVLPSLTEGQPMALLEAMAAGKAIVATSVGDVPRILKNGEIGCIVAPENPDELADGILMYIKDRPKALKNAGQARAEAFKKYSSARMAKQYLQVYESLTN